MNIRLTALAEADIAQVFQWYERQREDLGYGSSRESTRQWEQIAAHPQL